MANSIKGFISIDIPTKPYIKAYLVNRFGAQPILNRDNKVGNKFYDLLERFQDESATDFPKLKYKENVRVFITKRSFIRRGCSLSESGIISFNRFLEEDIKEKFYLIMNTLIKFFPNFEANLEYVRKELGIDEKAWSFEAMKKDYYRYRISNNLPLLYDNKIKKGAKLTKDYF